MSETPLGLKVKGFIRRMGPMPISHLITMALQDPTHGYYTTAAKLGAQGDFITAPLISARFSAAVASWVYKCWESLGCPKQCPLIELGPGTGQLMADIMQCLPSDCRQTIKIVLCEISLALKEQQSKQLNAFNPSWISNWQQMPEGLKIVIGNEFLDTLSTEQLVFSQSQWHQRCVGLVDDALAYVKGRPYHRAQIPLPATAEEGDLYELPSEAMSLLTALHHDFQDSSSNSSSKDRAGAALFIDYGDVKALNADSLQALARHKKVPVLQTLGDADVTTRVNLDALTQSAAALGFAFDGPVSQTDFLNTFGEPPSALGSADDLAAWQRLTDPKAMGGDFQAISFRANQLEPLL